MEKYLRTLKIIISSEVAAYKELLALSEQKKDVLINNQTKELNEIVSKEQSILGKIKQHEHSREDCTAKISHACGLSGVKIDLQTIIDNAENPLRKDIIELRCELKKVVSELSNINEQNKMLIDTHRKFVSFSLEAITGQMNTLNTYSNAGLENDTKAVHMLLDSTV